jgi:hypothetical protein
MKAFLPLKIQVAAGYRTSANITQRGLISNPAARK